jgi:hypothetical protein
VRPFYDHQGFRRIRSYRGALMNVTFIRIFLMKVTFIRRSDHEFVTRGSKVFYVTKVSNADTATAGSTATAGHRHDRQHGHDRAPRPTP